MQTSENTGTPPTQAPLLSSLSFSPLMNQAQTPQTANSVCQKTPTMKNHTNVKSGKCPIIRYLRLGKFKKIKLFVAPLENQVGLFYLPKRQLCPNPTQRLTGRAEQRSFSHENTVFPT
jgi:hypothetical protein